MNTESSENASRQNKKGNEMKRTVLLIYYYLYQCQLRLVSWHSYDCACKRLIRHKSLKSRFLLRHYHYVASGILAAKQQIHKRGHSTPHRGSNSRRSLHSVPQNGEWGEYRISAAIPEGSEASSERALLLLLTSSTPTGVS